MAYRSTDLNEVHEQLTIIAGFCARSLGAGWSYVKPDERSCYHKITGPNEATLYFSVEGTSNGDRVHISGGFHVGKSKYGSAEYVRPNCGDPGSITVAIARGDEKIAQEIKSRFLPKYLPALAQAITQRDASEAYLQAKLTNLQHLQNLAGDMRDLGRDAERGYIHIGDVYGHIEATNDTASLELRCLTIKQAEAVIKVLRRIA